MDIRNGIDLQECPLCGGAGILEIEQDWCVNISCLDCGCQTADVAYKKPEDRDAAIAQALELWNLGKVVACSPGL